MLARNTDTVRTNLPLMEFWTFFHTMPAETRILVALGVGVGLRISEALGADIEDLDVSKCTYRPKTQYKPSRRVGDKKVPTHDRLLTTLAEVG
ncbi:hypothetical protein [Nocardia altamirensis]|uniref:hypothetical protein n=1 Tax=Nocardia altamirensis TaxID=472158 RepID=UPI0008406D46|nr:hypothetical protein [Nocardia altamirensis]